MGIIGEIVKGLFKLIKLFLVFSFKGVRYFFKTGYKLYSEFSEDYKKHKKMSNFSRSSRNEIL
jgi:hypothetical protein